MLTITLMLIIFLVIAFLLPPSAPGTSPHRRMTLP